LISHLLIKVVVGVAVMAAVVSLVRSEAQAKTERVVCLEHHIVVTFGFLQFLVLVLLGRIVAGWLSQVDDLKVVILVLDGVPDILAVLERYGLVHTLEDDLNLLNVNGSPLPLAEALHVVEDPFGILGLLLALSIFKQALDHALLVDSKLLEVFVHSSTFTLAVSFYHVNQGLVIERKWSLSNARPTRLLANARLRFFQSVSFMFNLD
jgi:hypothetical protein